MTVIREFISDFTKIRRTPVILLYLVLPVVITSVFLVYYKYAGYHIIPDVRLFLLYCRYVSLFLQVLRCRF